MSPSANAVVLNIVQRVGINSWLNPLKGSSSGFVKAFGEIASRKDVLTGGCTNSLRRFRELSMQCSEGEGVGGVS